MRGDASTGGKWPRAGFCVADFAMHVLLRANTGLQDRFCFSDSVFCLYMKQINRDTEHPFLYYC